MQVLGNAFLHSRSGHDDLESRSGRQLGLYGLIHQRVFVIVDQLAPLVATDFDGEVIGIKRWAAHHCQNFTAARVHGDDSAILIAKCLFCGDLQVDINSELKIFPGLRVLFP